eukprot:scaffold183198_cov43-Attheya_sp.AAC.3
MRLPDTYCRAPHIHGIHIMRNTKEAKLSAPRRTLAHDAGLIFKVFSPLSRTSAYQAKSSHEWMATGDADIKEAK